MNIGVPREAEFENRVGMTPAGAGILVAEGHRVFVESKAGVNAGFSDEDYLHAGTQVVYSPEEAWGRADLVAKVRAPVARELPYLHEEQILTGFLHLAVAPRSLIDVLLHRRITAIAYETIQERDGRLPVVIPMSEIAGRMIPVVAGGLLNNAMGGRGILLSGLPGIPSAEIVIVGAGVVGYNAAKTFLGLGAQVTLLDNNPDRLRDMDDRLRGRANTMLANTANLRKVCRFADVLVGCVLVPGARAPRLISRDMVQSMKRGAVLMDVSIDQGGCVEGTRPTTLRDPVYMEDGVVHYCVPNMSAAVARTATYAMSNATMPYLAMLAREGLVPAVREHPALARGVMTARGRLVSPVLAHFGLEAHPLDSLLGAELR